MAGYQKKLLVDISYFQSVSVMMVLVLMKVKP